MQKAEIKIWGIHAGALGEIDSKFLSKAKPCIGIGWGEVGNLSKIPAERERFKEKLVKAYPDTKKGAIPTSAGMLFRFACEIQLGDIVVYPSKIDKLIHIGRITGTYEYNPSVDKNYPNIRSVEWLKHIPRTKFSQGALYEIGSALSLFQVKNYADEFIAALSGETISEPEEEDITVAKVAEEIEQNT